MRRAAVAPIVLLLGLAASNSARADGLTARLVLDGDSCGRGEIERRTRELAGRDPFDAAATWTLDIQVETNADGVAARVTLLDAAGTPHGARIISAKDCAELSGSIALVIAMTLARESAAEDPPPEPPVPEPPAPEPASPPPPQRPRVHGAEVMSLGATVGAAPEREPARFGVLGGVTTNDDGTTGLLAGARFRSGKRSIALELGLQAFESLAIGPGHVEVARAELAAIPCRHFGPFAACASAAVGVLRGRGVGLAVSERATTPLAAVGGRIAWESRLARWLALRVHVEGRALLTRNHFLVDDMQVWTTGPVEGSAGMAFVANIP